MTLSWVNRFIFIIILIALIFFSCDKNFYICKILDNLDKVIYILQIINWLKESNK